MRSTPGSRQTRIFSDQILAAQCQVQAARPAAVAKVLVHSNHSSEGLGAQIYSPQPVLKAYKNITIVNDGPNCGVTLAKLLRVINYDRNHVYSIGNSGYSCEL
jgi:hypothetical protein